jgi:hypothetical protein
MYTLSTTVDPGYIDLVVAVPEPSTLVLLGIAAAGLLASARNRRRTGTAACRSPADKNVCPPEIGE